MKQRLKYIAVKPIEKSLKEVFIVSQIELINGGAGEVQGEKIKDMSITVLHAQGKKCERCWVYDNTVGNNSKGQNICNRCATVLNS